MADSWPAAPSRAQTEALLKRSKGSDTGSKTFIGKVGAQRVEVPKAWRVGKLEIWKVGPKGDVQAYAPPQGDEDRSAMVEKVDAEQVYKLQPQADFGQAVHGSRLRVEPSESEVQTLAASDKPTKYYTLYSVRPGDTLERLADPLQSSAREQVLTKLAEIKELKRAAADELNKLVNDPDGSIGHCESFGWTMKWNYPRYRGTLAGVFEFMSWISVELEARAYLDAPLAPRKLLHFWVEIYRTKFDDVPLFEGTSVRGCLDLTPQRTLPGLKVSFGLHENFRTDGGRHGIWLGAQQRMFDLLPATRGNAKQLRAVIWEEQGQPGRSFNLDGSQEDKESGRVYWVYPKWSLELRCQAQLRLRWDAAAAKLTLALVGYEVGVTISNPAGDTVGSFTMDPSQLDLSAASVELSEQVTALDFANLRFEAVRDPEFWGFGLVALRLRPGEVTVSPGSQGRPDFHYWQDFEDVQWNIEGSSNARFETDPRAGGWLAVGHPGLGPARPREEGPKELHLTGAGVLSLFDKALLQHRFEQQVWKDEPFTEIQWKLNLVQRARLDNPQQQLQIGRVCDDSKYNLRRKKYFEELAAARQAHAEQVEALEKDPQSGAAVPEALQHLCAAPLSARDLYLCNQKQLEPIIKQKLIEQASAVKQYRSTQLAQAVKAQEQADEAYYYATREGKPAKRAALLQAVRGLKKAQRELQRLSNGLSHPLRDLPLQPGMQLRIPRTFADRDVPWAIKTEIWVVMHPFREGDGRPKYALKRKELPHCLVVTGFLRGSKDGKVEEKVGRIGNDPLSRLGWGFSLIFPQNDARVRYYPADHVDTRLRGCAVWRGTVTVSDNNRHPDDTAALLHSLDLYGQSKPAEAPKAQEAAEEAGALADQVLEALRPGGGSAGKRGVALREQKDGKAVTKHLITPAIPFSPYRAEYLEIFALTYDRRLSEVKHLQEHKWVKGTYVPDHIAVHRDWQKVDVQNNEHYKKTWRLLDRYEVFLWSMVYLQWRTKQRNVYWSHSWFKQSPPVEDDPRSEEERRREDEKRRKWANYFVDEFFDTSNPARFQAFWDANLDELFGSMIRRIEREDTEADDDDPWTSPIHACLRQKIVGPDGLGLRLIPAEIAKSIGALDQLHQAGEDLKGLFVNDHEAFAEEERVRLYNLNLPPQVKDDTEVQLKHWNEHIASKLSLQFGFGIFKLLLFVLKKTRMVDRFHPEFFNPDNLLWRSLLNFFEASWDQPYPVEGKGGGVELKPKMIPRESVKNLGWTLLGGEEDERKEKESEAKRLQKLSDGAYQRHKAEKADEADAEATRYKSWRAMRNDQLAKQEELKAAQGTTSAALSAYGKERARLRSLESQQELYGRHKRYYKQLANDPSRSEEQRKSAARQMNEWGKLEAPARDAAKAQRTMTEQHRKTYAQTAAIQQKAQAEVDKHKPPKRREGEFILTGGYDYDKLNEMHKAFITMGYEGKLSFELFWIFWFLKLSVTPFFSYSGKATLGARFRTLDGVRNYVKNHIWRQEADLAGRMINLSAQQQAAAGDDAVQQEAAEGLVTRVSLWWKELKTNPKVAKKSRKMIFINNVSEKQPIDWDQELESCVMTGLQMSYKGFSFDLHTLPEVLAAVDGLTPQAGAEELEQVAALTAGLPDLAERHEVALEVCKKTAPGEGAPGLDAESFLALVDEQRNLAIVRILKAGPRASESDLQRDLKRALDSFFDPDNPLRYLVVGNAYHEACRHQIKALELEMLKAKQDASKGTRSRMLELRRGALLDAFLVCTSYEDRWEHFRSLRCKGLYGSAALAEGGIELAGGVELKIAPVWDPSMAKKFPAMKSIIKAMQWAEVSARGTLKASANIDVKRETGGAQKLETRLGLECSAALSVLGFSASFSLFQAMPVYYRRYLNIPAWPLLIYWNKDTLIFERVHNWRQFVPPAGNDPRKDPTFQQDLENEGYDPDDEGDDASV